MRADADANEAGANVLRALANKNAFAFELREKRGTGGSKVGQKKISGARKGFDTEMLQFCGEPFARTHERFARSCRIVLPSLSAASAATSAARFTGNGGTARRRMASEVSVRDDGAEPKCGETGGF